MLKKDITFEDLETGQPRTETWYFNLNKAELTEMEVTAEGGYEAATQRIVESGDGKAIMAEFRRFILMSVGEKTEAGGFRKTQEIRDRFEESPAYSELFMELVTSAEAGASFLSAIVPQQLGNRLLEHRNRKAQEEAQAKLAEETGLQFGRSAREEAEYQRNLREEFMNRPEQTEAVVEATIEPAEVEPVHIEPVVERNVFDQRQYEDRKENNKFHAQTRGEARRQLGLDISDDSEMNNG